MKELNGGKMKHYEFLEMLNTYFEQNKWARNKLFGIINDLESRFAEIKSRANRSRGAS